MMSVLASLEVRGHRVILCDREGAVGHALGGIGAHLAEPVVEVAPAVWDAGSWGEPGGRRSTASPPAAGQQPSPGPGGSSAGSCGPETAVK